MNVHNFMHCAYVWMTTTLSYEKALGMAGWKSPSEIPETVPFKKIFIMDIMILRTSDKPDRENLLHSSRTSEPYHLIVRRAFYESQKQCFLFSSMTL